MRVRSAIFSLFLLSSPALAADYWPLPASAVYTYRNAGGATLEVTYGPAGWRTLHYDSPGYTVTQTMSEDANGDVVLTYLLGLGDGAIDPDYWRDLGPAFVYLDLPLTIGKVWTPFVDTSCCYNACSVTMQATVLGPTQVTVPAGTFNVIEVAFVNGSTACAPDLPWGTMALDKDLGPVVMPGGYELESVTGVVGVQGDSWGSLKALYR